MRNVGATASTTVKNKFMAGRHIVRIVVFSRIFSYFPPKKELSTTEAEKKRW